MTNRKPVKPKENHPWKNAVPSKVAAWTARESHVEGVRTVTLANPRTWRNHEEAHYNRSQH